MNVVVVQGILSRDPQERELPSGSRVVAYEITVARSGARAESVPVVWVDPPAARTALGVGAEVVAVGRVRRRFFRVGGSTQSRTEVVADSVVATQEKRRARTAISRAARALASGSPSAG